MFEDYRSTFFRDGSAFLLTVCSYWADSLLLSTLRMSVSMEPTRFDHSTKNIPLPSEKDYNQTLSEKTELLCKRMRWKAFFFLNPNMDGNTKETIGFNSKKTEPQITEILNFEKRLLQMIANIRFRKVNCSFQRKFSSNIQNNIMKSAKLLVPADKTANFYKMDASSYNVLLNKNITKTYKKVNPNVANSIELKTKAPSTRIRIFLNPKLFLSGYGYRPHAYGEFASESGNFWIRTPEWKFLNPITFRIRVDGWIRIQGVCRGNLNSKYGRRSKANSFCAALAYF